jgi:hypothetical protein
MDSALTDRQKAIIRELVDQLIVNHGILVQSSRNREIDDSEYSQLTLMAFKYYRMIYNSEDPLDIDLKDSSRGVTLPLTKTSDTKSCIGCGQDLSDADGHMPVCQACRAHLKADYDVLKSLLH